MDAQTPNKRKRMNDDENEQLRARIAELEDRLAAKEEGERGNDEAPSQKHYKHVHVLTTQWAEDDLGVGMEVWELSNVFKKKYGYNVTQFVIPDCEPEPEEGVL